MKKRIALILMVLALLITSVACGGDPKPKPTPTDPKGSEEAPKTDVTDPPAPHSEEKAEIYVLIKNRGDLSFWDSIASGGDRAAVDFADKANVYVIETTADVMANLDAMYEAVDKGANLIITAGDYKDNVAQLAVEHPEVGFVMISEDMTKDGDNNIYCIDFRVSEAAFLGGVVAADIASSDKDNVAATKTVGFIGGMDEVTVIQEFLLGYIQGAKFYDPETKIVTNYVGGWNDPDTAKTQAVTQYKDAGVDVIFAAAGASGNGVHTAAAQENRYVVGVDTNQALMYENDPEIKATFVTSVLKELGNGIYATITRFLNEGLPYGEYEILGLEEAAVAIVEDDHLASLLSEKGKQKLEEAKAGIISGDVEVVSAIGKDQTEIKALIETLSE